MSEAEDKSLSPIPFVVIECSSGEATTLHDFNEDGDGWQSSESAEGPSLQRLVLKVEHKDAERLIHEIQIICHECKTPEKVEISLGSDESNAANSFDECQSIAHLGYITIANPEKSNWPGRLDVGLREQKTVPIERSADFVQLVLRGCHKNSHNPYNQVGIVGIRILGAAIDSSTSSPTLAIESVQVPMKKIEVQMNPADRPVSSLTAVSSLPASVKHELDIKTQSSIDRLEVLKKERASLEDFDMAGRIKESLGNVYALLIAFNDCERRMRKAAEMEDYALASQLKVERDTKRKVATTALQNAAGKFAATTLQDVAGKYIRKTHEKIDDLSISTIKDESMSQKSILSSHSFPESAHNGKRFDNSRTENSESSEGDSQNDDSTSDQGDEHPLGGVENAEELPAPEEISPNGTASPDILSKADQLFGSYITKCFFSRNWTLREAALAKMSLLVEQMCINSDGNCAGVLFSMIEFSLDDKNVQVFLAALILLDETLVQLESIELPQKNISPLLSTVITNLLGKLADSTHKVGEGSTLALLSVASSSAVDTDSLVRAASKRIRSKDSNSRTLRARLHFLEILAAEFGEHVVWKRVVDFAKLLCTHKDGGVRDAAKSLLVTLMMIHGDEQILQSSEIALSERLLAEFRSRFRGLAGPRTKEA